MNELAIFLVVSPRGTQLRDKDVETLQVQGAHKGMEYRQSLIQSPPIYFHRLPPNRAFPIAS